MTAARHTREILENSAHILAIEVYCAARALDLRLRQAPAARMGIGVVSAHQQVRSRVPYQAGDAWWGPEIEQVSSLLSDPKFVAAVRQAEG
jgi:histidine ammonia-lyase